MQDFLMLNATSPESKGTFKVCTRDLQPCLFKYISVFEAFRVLPKEVLPLLGAMLLQTSGNYKNTLVDFKVRQHKAGSTACPLARWHIDCTDNPWHPSRHERHLIWSDCQGTEFMKEPFKVLSGQKSVVGIDFGVQDYYKSRPFEIVQYTRHNAHRGPKITEDCKRTILRVTETDLIGG